MERLESKPASLVSVLPTCDTQLFLLWSLLCWQSTNTALGIGEVMEKLSLIILECLCGKAYSQFHVLPGVGTLQFFRQRQNCILEIMRFQIGVKSQQI